MDFFRVWYTITVGHVNDECTLGHINSLKHYITIHDEYGWIGLDTSPNEGHVNSPYSSRWVSVPGHPIPRFFFLIPSIWSPRMNRSNPPIPNQALFEEAFNIKIIKGKGILGLMDGCGNTLYLFAMNGVFFSVDGQHPAPVGKLLR